MESASLYSVKAFTPGGMTHSQVFDLLGRWKPRLSLEEGEARLWSVEMEQTGFTIAMSPVETLWLLFWGDTLAALEGDFPRTRIDDMRSAFRHKFGEGISTWGNSVSSALVEIDEAGRCYFRIACRALFETYSNKLNWQLMQERRKHRQAVIADI